MVYPQPKDLPTWRLCRPRIFLPRMYKDVQLRKRCIGKFEGTICGSINDRWNFPWAILETRKRFRWLAKKEYEKCNIISHHVWVLNKASDKKVVARGTGWDISVAGQGRRCSYFGRFRVIQNFSFLSRGTIQWTHSLIELLSKQLKMIGEIILFLNIV